MHLLIPVKYLDNFIKKLPTTNKQKNNKINNKIEANVFFLVIKTLSTIEEALLESDGVKIMKIAEELNYDILEFNY